MRLLRVELRRLFARKAVWLALAAIVVVAGMSLYGVHEQARWFNDGRGQAQEAYEQALAEWEVHGEEMLQQCLRDQQAERVRSGDPRINFGCSDMEPRLEHFIGVLPTLLEQYRELLGSLVYPFLFLALAVGSTHVAAEFAHRTMGLWLTFVPRRVPVLVSKLVAPGLAAVPVVALGLLLVLVGVPLLFRWHGIDDGVPSGGWTSLGWMSLRVLVLAVAAGVFGAAAGFLLRHTGAVIGLMVGYLLLAEGIVRSMLQSATPYLLGVNIEAFVRHGTTWTEWPMNCDDVTVPCREILHEVSFTHGVVVLLVVLGTVVALALVRFQRTDVE